MGFRFFRRVRLLPGVTMNVSRSGPSLSVGPRGANITVGPRGIRNTLGLPGTGLFYTTTHSWVSSARTQTPQPSPVTAISPPADLPKELAGLAGLPELSNVPGRAVTPIPVGALVIAGIIVGGVALAMGSTATILFILAAIGAGVWYIQSPPIQGANALKAGYEALRHGRLDEAETALQRCLSVAPGISRARYLLALTYVGKSRFADAVSLLKAMPDELGAAPLYISALWALQHYDDALHAIEDLPPQARLLLFFQNMKARILIDAGKADIALEVLLDGPTRKRIQHDEQLLDLHYLLGRAYEALGRKRDARREYARVIADSADFLDVQERYDRLAPNIAPS